MKKRGQRKWVAWGALVLTHQLHAQIRVNDVDWPPYFLTGKQMTNGATAGIAHEIIELCLPHADTQKLGWKFEEYPPKRTATMAQEGEIDLIVYSKTKEREEFLHYGTEVLFEPTFVPYVAAGGKIAVENLKDVEGKVVAVTAGLAYWPEYKDAQAGLKANGTRFLESQDTLTSMKMVAAGRADVGFEQLDTLFWLAHTNNMASQLHILPRKFANKPYYLTIPKKSPRIQDKVGFLAKMDVCVAKLKGSSEFKKILNRYGVH